MVDRAATSKTFCFCYLTYGNWSANQTDSLYQTVNGIVGNIDWGESLSIVSCEFPGLNSSGARRRAASKWLAVETKFFPRLPHQQKFKACNLTQALTGFGYTLK